MNTVFAPFQHIISSYLFLFSWKDFAEIVVFSTVFYYCALWLKKDSQKNLLPYFYGYVFTIVLCNFLELPTLSNFLFIFSPAVIMIFMFMHQETLQKNMISLKNITLPEAPHSPDWLSGIMKATLKMLSDNKDIILLIEHTDSMNSFLQTPDRLDVPVNDGLISILFQRLYNPTQMCWITSSGIIRSINASFKASWHPTTYQSQNAWIDDAVAYTAKTDAVIIFANAQLHCYSIAYQGTVKNNLSMEQAFQLIRKLIDYSIPLPKKGLSHGIAPNKKFAQHSP